MSSDDPAIMALVEAHSRRQAGHSWESIAPVMGCTAKQARQRYSDAVRPGGKLHRALDAIPEASQRTNGARTVLHVDDRPVLRGAMASDAPDPLEVWARATREWEATAAKLAKESDQCISFRDGPACLFFVADTHLGGAGVHYPRIKSEFEIMASTPNSAVVVVGDVVDNFILHWCTSIRHDTRLTISDEWVLAKSMMDLIGPRLVAVVSGNHDWWSRRASGVDLLRELVTKVRPGVLYHSDDMRATIEVGSASWTMRARHKWRGTSIYNPTHGQERAARWDRDADILVGAHTHVGGEARTFSVGGRSRVAVQCGTYKLSDPYAVQEGFPVSGPSTAVALILDEDGGIAQTQHLGMAKKIMQAMA